MPVPTIQPDEPPSELPEVEAGRLPDRYRDRMQDQFLARALPRLRPGVRILDVGAGRAPTLAPKTRPTGCWYVGTDRSAEELDAAPPGAYDETIVSDVTEPFPRADRFDLVLSWQVLEHVGDVGDALRQMGECVVPGGLLLVQTSGSRAVFSVASRMMPHRARVFAMERLLGVPAEEKFPTTRQPKTEASLRAALTGFSSVDVLPFYRGAAYFRFSRALQRLYVVYEDWAAADRRPDLATHYLVAATR